MSRKNSAAITINTGKDTPLVKRTHEALFAIAMSAIERGGLELAVIEAIWEIAKIGEQPVVIRDCNFAYGASK